MHHVPVTLYTKNIANCNLYSPFAQDLTGIRWISLIQVPLNARVLVKFMFLYNILFYAVNVKLFSECNIYYFTPKIITEFAENRKKCSLQ